MSTRSYVIHGNWTQDVHLNMRNAYAWQADHAVDVEVVAEGFRKAWRFPVEVLSPSQFERMYPDRRQQIPSSLRGLERPD